MRNIIILVLILGFSYAPLKAQSADNSDGTNSRIHPGIGWFYSGLTPFAEGKTHKFDRLVLDIVYNDWRGDIKAFETPWTSIGFNSAFMFDFPFTKNNTVGMGLGLGFSHYVNRTARIFEKDYINELTVISSDQSDINDQRFKMGFNYLEIPLEFRFRIPYGEKDKQHIKFLIGGKIGYRLNSFTKTTTGTNDHKHAVKEIHLPDSNPLRYGVTARVGIRNWAIFGAYYFSPLFKSEESVRLFPFSVGISISLF